MRHRWNMEKLKKRWSFVSYSHGSDILMRTRLSMCSGYGWVIDLHFVSIAGWSATVVLVGGMSQLHGKSMLAGFRSERGRGGCRSCVRGFPFVWADFLNNPCLCLLFSCRYCSYCVSPISVEIQREVHWAVCKSCAIWRRTKKG